MLDGETKLMKQANRNKLKRIAELSKGNPEMEFNKIIGHINEGLLERCFHKLDGRKAVGIDRETKSEYGQNLKANPKDLVARMKTMSYRPAPVREVQIPKPDGGKRPLGISTIEDKMVQMAFKEVLEAIYEPLFHKLSYGFRPGRNCHQALKACVNDLYEGSPEVVIDADMKNYFGSIDHKKLILLLRMKIKDERFIRYIIRMLKAGVLSEGELRVTEEGTPQGSVVSPILANIFAHYALDEWFMKGVKPQAKGQVEMYRYCDDFVIISGDAKEAEEIRRALEGRLKRFSLELNEEKTKVIPFNKKRVQAGQPQGKFDFLGFTIHLGKSKTGAIIPKAKTSVKRLRIKLGYVSKWCRKYRCHRQMSELWEVFRSKLRGHIQYYGVSHNFEQVAKFIRRAVKIFLRWMNRRGGNRHKSWEEFRKYLDAFPPPRVKVHHRLF